MLELYMTEPHTSAPNAAATMPLERLDANSRRSIRAARTKRLQKRLGPFDAIDAEVVALIQRLTPEDGKPLGTNVARTILQAQTLRKELLLGKLKAEEVERRVEEMDIREEWEKVKRALGIG
jgi:hypothetical protein